MATNNNSRNNSSKSGAKKKNTAIIVLCAVLALIFIVVLCIYLIINSKLNKINITNKGEYVTTESTAASQQTEPTTFAEASHDENTQLEQAESQGANFFENGEVAHSDNVRNILLIGVDNRHYEDISKNPGNSDVMILVSINKDKKKIFLSSFMRDTYAYIDYPAELEAIKYVDGSDKLNEANARGGPELLLDTIEGNFKVKVDEYVAVDFYSLIEIIDILGGVELTITDEQATVMNNYIRDMDMYRPNVTDYMNDNVFSQGGTYLMNGTQAVAYCRDRYSGGNDYGRTDKQREVLSLVFEKAKKMSLSQLNDICDAVLPLVYTNISKSEITSLITEVGTYLSYDMEQVRVPFDGLFTSSTATTRYGNQGVLIPDYEATAAKLKATIYGE